MAGNISKSLKIVTDEQPISSHAQQVRDALVDAGLETPMVAQHLSSKEKIQKLTKSFTDICQTLELDLSDDSLTNTPERIAKMYVNELFSGLDYSNFPKITDIDNKMGLDEMVLVKDIGLTSTCEHHFITIDGTVRVAYIPNKKIIGLSKINRIVQFFGQRPQVQERLNQQILIALKTLLDTEHVAVSINATHFCVKARGIMDASSNTSTLSLSGLFKKDASKRQEFLTQ